MKSLKSFSLFLTAAIILSLALTTNAVRSSMSRRNGTGGHARSSGDSATGRNSGDSATGRNSNFNTQANQNNNFNTQGNQNNNNNNIKGDSNHQNGKNNGKNNGNYHGGDNSYGHGYNHNPKVGAVYPAAAVVPVSLDSTISCNQNGADYCTQYPVGTFCPQTIFQYSCVCYQDGTCSTVSGTNSCSECQQVDVVSVLDNYACQAC